jgi:hypothetical protein
MRTASLLALLGIVYFCMGCGGSDPITITPQTTGTIKGVIRDAQTLVGISSVSIQTEPPSEAVYTDSSGGYSITAKAGDYIIRAVRFGYSPASAGVSVLSGTTSAGDFSMSNLSSGNRPPSVPVAVKPVNGDNAVDKSAPLEWASTDPDGDSLWFTIYLDTSNPPTKKVADSIAQRSYLMSELQDSTTYYWRIVANDKFNAQTTSKVYSFRTKNPKPPVTAKDMLVYLAFEGDVLDSMMNAQLSSSFTPTFAQGVNGVSSQSFLMQSQSQFLSYVSKPSLDLPEEFTICAWINPSSTPSDFTQIVGRFVRAGGTGNASYSLTMVKDGFIQLNTHDGTTTSRFLSSIPVKIGEWSHIAMTRSSNGTGSIFIGGNLVAQGVCLPAQPSKVDLTIGGYADGVGTGYRGMIDNVRIYSRELSLTEIRALYNEKK